MATVVEFKSEIGVSVEIEGTWYKFNCGLVVKPDKGDNMEEVKKKAWNTVESEISKQVKEQLAALKEAAKK